MRRFFFALILIFSPLTIALPAASAADPSDLRAQELGEIALIKGRVMLSHTFSDSEDQLQVGEKVFAGDIIKTTANSAIEIVFGINARARLEGAGELRLLEMTKTERVVDAVPATFRSYDLLLVSGVLRLRVRENTISTQQFTVRAGDVNFILPRSDLLISRAAGASSPRKMLRCLQAWGQVEVQVRGASKGDDHLINYQPGELIISERPEENALPLWSPLSFQAAKVAIEKLAKFSVDTPLDLPRETIDDSPETMGA